MSAPVRRSYGRPVTGSSPRNYRIGRGHYRTGVTSRFRIVGRRTVVLAVVLLQLAFIARGYSADHKEFAFQMFPESSTWRADVVRVTAHGRRVPVEIPWAGYRWDLARHGARAPAPPSFRRHADAGLDNQLAFLRAALDWVAANTPRDHYDPLPGGDA